MKAFEKICREKILCGKTNRGKNVKFAFFRRKLTNLSFNLDLPTSSPTKANYSKSLDALRVNMKDMKPQRGYLESLGDSASDGAPICLKSTTNGREIDEMYSFRQNVCRSCNLFAVQSLSRVYRIHI